MKDKGTEKVENYVYADVILLENLIMNYLILWSTARLTRYSYSKVKLIIASLLGAVYAVLSYFPEYSYLYSFFVKILFSILIVIIAYTPVHFHLLLKLTGIFYIVSFIFGGAAFGLFYFINGLKMTSNGISFIGDFPLKILVAAVVAAYFTIRYSWDYVQYRIKRERLILKVEMSFDKRQLSLDALVDTGNSLKDPITNAPVMIIEYGMMRDLLPEDIQKIFERCSENDLNAIAEIMTVSKWASRFRIIPFKSLGRENGMLIGFKPDTVTIFDSDRRIQLSNIIVAVYRKNLSKDGEYSALIHPEMLKEN
ncbi:MAG TPA: sigma-E processing peptidase SpoIIGA [Clostridia bacterium]|nr:sigma-E processing peptidase SpoIIGA [Clostridia bacterium]